MEGLNKSKTQEDLELKFKSMMEQAQTDPQLHDEVFSTIGKIETAADLIDLFSVKLIQTEGEILNNMYSSNFEEE